MQRLKASEHYDLYCSDKGIPKRYFLVGWLFVLSAIVYLDRINISIAGIAIGKEFHASNTRLGWIFSAFLIGYALFQVPAGLIADRHGPRLSLAIASVWWSVFTVLATVIPPNVFGALPLLITIRFALGAGEAIMYPATSRFVKSWFPVAERGRASGIIFAGVGAGSGLTPPLVTIITLHYGWRASFWFSAALGLLVGAIWYVLARDNPTAVTRSQNYVPYADDLGNQTARWPWTNLLASKELLLLTFSYFSFGYVAWLFFAWFYIYLAEGRGFNLKTSAIYSSLPFLCMTVGCILGGLASDGLSKRSSYRMGRCIFPAIAMSLAALLLILGSHAESASAAGLILAAGAGTLYIAQSCYWAVAADVSGGLVSVASGIMNMGAQIGGACTAILTPLLVSRFGWRSPFYVGAFIAALGSICWLVVKPTMRTD